MGSFTRRLSILTRGPINAGVIGLCHAEAYKIVLEYFYIKPYPARIVYIVREIRGIYNGLELEDSI